MLHGALPRQFIRNKKGKPIAVILPIEEYELVRTVLEKDDQTEDERLAEIKVAAQDPLFLADLEKIMTEFEVVDAEWWEIAA